MRAAEEGLGRQRAWSPGRALESFRFRKWDLEVDRQATRDAYAATEIGWAEYCGCVHCKNFLAARSGVYPPEMLALLDRLGIDPVKELEVVPFQKLDAETYFYAGWFQFVGSIRSGSDYWKAAPGGGLTNDPEGTEFLGEAFRMGFTSRLTRVPRPFRGRTTTQLEFGVAVPWIIPRRMPDRE